MSQRSGAGSITTRSTPPAQEITTSKLTTEDLEVNGTTSTVHSTNTVISDKLLELANGTTGTPSGDVGVIVERGSSDNAAIIWDESADAFVMGTTSATGGSSGDLSVTVGDLKVSTVTADGSLFIKEKDDAVADVEAYGQLWVNTATPNELYFTTDAGDDIQITTGTAMAGVSLANGSDNRVITATGAAALNGEANLTFDGSTLAVTGAMSTTTTASVGTDLSVNGGDIQYGNGQDATLTIAAVSGTNTAGKNLTIAAGQGTGSGTGGAILFRTADGGGSGSGANSLVTALTIADDTSALFASNCQVTGDIIVSGGDIQYGNGQNATMSIAAVSGTNTAGKSLTISGGQSTGNAAGGAIVFKSSAAGGSGSSTNSLATVFTIENDGDIVVPGDIEMTDGSAIVDASNAKLLHFCSVGSAVNYVEVENAADGTAPAISVLGDSTNITMSLKPKGTGGVRIFGSTAAAASLLLNEDSDNGTNFMKFQAAANIASNHTYTWPAGLPGGDGILKTTSGGTLSWVDEAPPPNDLNLNLHMQVFS
tara:strand:- start:22 stop:1638 length:1617 start_codon:yes stop_codon:yes gene_type:complete